MVGWDGSCALRGFGKPETIEAPDLHLTLVQEGKRLTVQPLGRRYVFLNMTPETAQASAQLCTFTLREWQRALGAHAGQHLA